MANKFTSMMWRTLRKGGVSGNLVPVGMVSCDNQQAVDKGLHNKEKPSTEQNNTPQTIARNKTSLFRESYHRRCVKS